MNIEKLSYETYVTPISDDQNITLSMQMTEMKSKINELVEAVNKTEKFIKHQHGDILDLIDSN
jgi:hypothetical protein